jgi:hypothetical protein
LKVQDTGIASDETEATLQAAASGLIGIDPTTAALTLLPGHRRGTVIH